MVFEIKKLLSEIEMIRYQLYQHPRTAFNFSVHLRHFKKIDFKSSEVKKKPPAYISSDPL
jgi:hypothetical protein